MMAMYRIVVAKELFLTVTVESDSAGGAREQALLQASKALPSAWFEDQEQFRIDFCQQLDFLDPEPWSG